MAAVEKIKISNALCFLTNKIHSVAAKPLKTLLLDYYTPEELSVVKDLLLCEPELMDNVTLPKISPRRRNSVNKPQLDLDDLFTILTDLDENRNLKHLPLFCATSPDKMPSIRLVDGDLAILWSKLAEFHEILISDRNDHMKYMDAMHDPEFGHNSGYSERNSRDWPKPGKTRRTGGVY